MSTGSYTSDPVLLALDGRINGIVHAALMNLILQIQDTLPILNDNEYNALPDSMKPSYLWIDESPRSMVDHIPRTILCEDRPERSDRIPNPRTQAAIREAEAIQRAIAVPPAIHVQSGLREAIESVGRGESPVSHSRWGETFHDIEPEDQ